MNYKDKVYSIVEGYINKATELTALENDLKHQKDAGTIARVKLEELQADLHQQRSLPTRALWRGLSRPAGSTLPPWMSGTVWTALSWTRTPSS